MAQSSLPTDQASAAEAQTRVDSAHAPENPVSNSLPSRELLEAIAGQDSEQAALQLRRQALELAGLLREKQRNLDQRESELNARTALLENEIRSNRLKQQTAKGPVETPGIELRRPTLTEALQAPSEEEPFFEEEVPSTEVGGSGETGPAKVDAESVILGRSPRVRPTLDDGPVAELRQQEAKLEARQQQLEHLQEQITQMHREALELRLATEELWGELVHACSSDELTERLNELRSRLAEHYRLANESLAQRTDELHRMRQELNEQQQRLRCQRRELQLWVDRRYDEIEARTSRLIQRERELDRLEAEFERQSMQWQRQREAYRQEIEQLTRSA